MDLMSGLWKNSLSLVGIGVLACFALMALTAPWLAPPENPKEPYLIPRESFLSTPAPPSPEAWQTFPPDWRKHPLGTTEGQRDIYYGLIWGTRTAFRAGLVVIGFSLAIGILLGAVAGFYGGWTDQLIMRLVDLFFAFPGFLATLVLISILGKGLNQVLLSLIIFGWPYYARLIRGDILAIKDREFVLAARVLGLSDWRILLRHILPNTIYSTLIVASLDIGTIVLSVSGLSFLGLGPSIDYADWGTMISFARNWIIGATGGDVLQYWYTVVYPGAAILLFVLGWNLLGDAFRDVLDPELRRSR